MSGKMHSRVGREVVFLNFFFLPSSVGVVD